MTTSSNQEKYLSKNPIQNFLIELFYHNLANEVGDLAGKTLLDAGCGEGIAIKKLLSRVKGKPSIIKGFDNSKHAVKIAQAKVEEAEFRVGDIKKIPYEDNFFDVVICLEVLEHIEEFQKAVTELIRVGKQHIIVSVPWEPYFSWGSLLSGKHLSNYGKHPEHINFWSKEDFKKIFEDCDVSVTAHFISLPWQIIHLEV